MSSLPRKKDAIAGRSLFGDPPKPATDVRPATRTGDPETSHQAARTVKYGPNQKAVFECFQYFGAMHDGQLIERYPAWRERMLDFRPIPMQTDSGLRSRRADLVKLGYLRDSHKRALLPTKRNATIWEITR